MRGPDFGRLLAKAGSSPILDAAQLKILRMHGTEHEVAAGDVLFDAGDETYDLIVVLEGEMEITIENRSSPGEPFVATYGPGQFLGEIGLLTGQRAFLPAVARTEGRILRVSHDQLRVVMTQKAALSELILRTFLIRHANLTTKGAGLTLIGSRFDADTRRILEVLARNRLPSTWLDLEGSPEAEAMLQELEVVRGSR